MSEKELLIFSTLRGLGVEVVSNLSISVDGVSLDVVSSQAEPNSQPLNTKIDALIVDCPTIQPQAKDLMTAMLGQGKPVLLILPLGIRPDQTVLDLNRDIHGQQLLTVRTYINENLPRILTAFISGWQDIKVLNKPSIKFTLRITPQIDRYLDWRVSGTGLTKADFVRRMITEGVIKNDDKYNLQSVEA